MLNFFCFLLKFCEPLSYLPYFNNPAVRYAAANCKGNCKMIFNSKKFILITAAAIIVCLACAADQPSGGEDDRQHVLILNSYHKEFQWTDKQVAGAREVLSANLDNLELYVEYMDTKRIYTKEYLEQLKHTYHLKYDGIGLDAIITTDDNALRFVMDHHEDLFQGAPVSFCGINNYSSFSFEGKDQFTGLVEVLDIKATIDLALKFHPATRKVYVIVDNTPTGIGQLSDIARAAAEYEELEFEYFKGQDYSTAELLDELPEMPEESIVLLAVWLRDKNNDYAAPEEVVPLISELSSVPVYGIIDMYLGQGIVGGKLLNSETHGRVAAERIVRILDGEKPSSIPPLVESQNPYMFDEVQLRRWHIDQSDLPKESIVINRSFSLYQTYRIQIWSIAAVFGFLFVVVALLIANIITRRRAEKALRQSEVKHRELTENLPQRIFHKDSNSVYVSCNKHYADDLGIKPDDIAGTTDFDYHPKELAEKYRADDKRLMQSGQTEEIEESYIKDGQKLFIQTVKKPLTDDAGNVTGILGIFWDITDRKQAELALRQSEDKYRTLVSHTPAVLWTSDQNGHTSFISSNVEQVYGYTQEKILSEGDRLWFGRIHPEDLSNVKAAYEAIMKTGEHYNVEYRIQREDGRWIWLHDTATRSYEIDGVFRIDGVFMDITERKQAEDKLKESEKRSWAYLEYSPACTKIVDLDFNLQYMSRSGVVGLHIDDITEFYGKPYPLDFYPDSFKKPMTKNLKKVKETGQIITQEASVVDIDGNELWFHSTLVPVNDDDGKIDYIMVVSIDTTDRKRAEQAREKLLVTVEAQNQQLIASEQQLKSSNQQLSANQQQLRASNQQLMANEQERENLVKILQFKNKELQDIVYTASHDLKSPLVNIDGFSGMLKSDCDQLLELLAEQSGGKDKTEQIESLIKESIPESLGFITGSSRKMSSLLDGLLQVSRVGSVEIKTKSLDINKTVREVLKTMEYQINEKNIRVSVDDLPGCIGDSTIVDNVFANLIGNAVKYLDPTRKGEIKISGKVEDDMSIYCVEDNGIGIEPRYHKKVFEIFHRLNPKEDVGGEGLGLTIVTRVLDRLGGSIRLESEAGKGSKFFIALPAGCESVNTGKKV